MNYEQDIKTLLTIGENIVIEFKRAGNGPEHDTYESICAFLNANKAINPGVITLSNLKPYSKNPIISNFFHQIGRADELGSGVRNLYHYVKLYSGADPIFDEEDVFRLTVPLNAEHSPEKSGGRNNETVNETVKRLIETRPGIGSARIIEETGKSRASVMRAIAYLKSINAIEHRGSDKTGGYYVLVNH